MAGFRTRVVTPGLQTQRVPRVPHESLLSVREVAARLGVCACTVYRICAEGKLAHVRIANAIRVAPEDVEWLVRRGGP